MIEAAALSVTLGGRLVLDRVSFEVPRGSWLMLIGPNGAGKSTALRALAGLVPYGGSVTLERRELAGAPRRERARCVAYVPQSPQLPAEMSVWEYTSLGRTPHLGYLGRSGPDDEHAVRSALDRLELSDMAGRRLGTLSGGERQRVVLARALAQQARVLLLDEPTSALDVGRQQDVLELVGELRRRHALTVVGAIHDLTLAGQYAEELLLLDHGRTVAAGPPRSVLRAPLLNAHYRARLRVGAPAGHGLIVTPCPPLGSPTSGASLGPLLPDLPAVLR
ncbi:MAG TPA: ABC transporter ATP-binding protein [Solirubrobacteraceae bacterium]|nr:ABC transporter ATP-binding protein [Solirubrobacteraceae bacterium]